MGLAQGQDPFRILVAEDNEYSRKLMVHLLHSVGFDVCEAVNGKDAVTQWKIFSPHLILMDMRMPETDGYDAVREIRRSEGNGHRTPIIALTSYAFEDDRLASLAAGCNDFIRKPFDEAELFKKIAFYTGVRYNYKSLELQAPTILTDILTPNDLAEFSDLWRFEFKDAAEKGKSKILMKLIEQIRAQHPLLADQLTDLVSAYRFIQLADLVNKREK